MTPLKSLLSRFQGLADRLPQPASMPAGQAPGNDPTRIDIVGLSRLGKLIFRRIETIQDYVSDCPAIALLIEGHKSVSVEPAMRQDMAPGQILLVPSGIPLSVVNIPDANSGRYCALVLEFDPDLIQRFIAAYPEIRDIAAAPQTGSNVLIATPDNAVMASMFGAMEMICPAKSPAPSAPETRHGPDRVLLRHRLMEVLLLLHQNRQAAPLLLPITHADMLERLRGLFRLAPARAWTKPDVAAILGTSPSGLDRQLRQNETNFREVLETERMAHARNLLQPATSTGVASDSTGGKQPGIKPALPIAEVAFQCGYQSPAAFGRAFYRHFGHTPTQSASSLV